MFSSLQQFLHVRGGEWGGRGGKMRGKREKKKKKGAEIEFGLSTRPVGLPWLIPNCKNSLPTFFLFSVPTNVSDSDPVPFMYLWPEKVLEVGTRFRATKTTGFSSQGRAWLHAFLCCLAAENTQPSPSLTRKPCRSHLISSSRISLAHSTDGW